MPAQLAGEVEGAETVGRVGREGKEVACGYVKAYVCQLFARHFKNLHVLQMEMGHASSDLLRTRYLNMEGITEMTAAVFGGTAMQGATPLKMAAPEQKRPAVDGMIPSGN